MFVNRTKSAIRSFELLLGGGTTGYHHHRLYCRLSEWNNRVIIAQNDTGCYQNDEGSPDSIFVG